MMTTPPDIRTSEQLRPIEDLFSRVTDDLIAVVGRPETLEVWVETDHDIHWQAEWVLKSGASVGYKLRTTFAGRIRVSGWTRSSKGGAVAHVESVPCSQVDATLMRFMPWPLRDQLKRAQTERGSK